MKYIQQESAEPLSLPNALKEYFADLKVGIFDIETTGLSYEKSKIILGGIAEPIFEGSSENHKIISHQYFAENLSDEKELLIKYKEALEAFDILISFNGNRFDVPFIQKRLIANKLHPLKIASSQSFDLYQALNKYSNLRKFLPNLKQKTIENYMGLWTSRADEISGAESVDLYYEYLRTKDLRLEKFILLHNSDDLFQLTRLLKITEKLDLHAIMFNMGFVVKLDDNSIYVNQIKKKNNALHISGSLDNIFLDYKAYDERYEIDISSKCNQFHMVFFDYPTSEPLDFGLINKELRLILKEILSKL